MTTTRTDRVLIVGAGITGLATSIALRAVGVDVTVVERRASVSRTGLGLNLQGNAVRALRELGRAEAVLAAGVENRRRDYLSARGQTLFTVDESAFWTGVAPPMVVRHGDLLRALAHGQEVRFGVAVDEIDAAGRRPRVRTTDGRDDVYDIVLGADGVRSAVRPAITAARPRSSTMTAAAWRFVTANPGVEHWTAWTGDGVVLLLLPVSDHEVYGYAAANGGGPVGAEPAWLEGAFRRFPATARRALRTATEGAVAPRRDPVEEVRAQRWHHGRVAVLGDAAHATGPVWAQGAAMGLEDGIVLAQEIAVAGATPKALAAWEARRRPRVSHLQAATDRMSRMARVPDPVARRVVPFLGPRGYRSTYAPLRATP